MLCMKLIFWKPKCWSVHLEGRGRVSEKVYCLHTHENVDIFGWPLSYVKNMIVYFSIPIVMRETGLNRFIDTCMSIVSYWCSKTSKHTKRSEQ